jgi:HSP20 family molecular chaperone IbpA
MAVPVPRLSVRSMDAKVEHNNLHVKGARKPETGKIWYPRKFEEGSFACSFQLPSL